VARHAQQGRKDHQGRSSPSPGILGTTLGGRSGTRGVAVPNARQPGGRRPISRRRPGSAYTNSTAGTRPTGSCI
jgi:hypothetical protein